ncbi:MAG: SIMPL domain-containing protein [Candidatus Micrarchaeaceae archaeon]
MKTEHITTLIAVIAILVLGLALWISILYPQGSVSQNLQKNTIKVTGTGTAYGYPAEGVVYATLNGTGATTAIANDNLSLTFANVNSSIFQFIGKNTSNIQTQYYYTSKIFNSSRYQAIENIKIIINSSKNISNVLDLLSNIKNVQITQAMAQLSSSQMNNMRNEALKLALNNATQQAEDLSNNATLNEQNITVGQSIIPVFPEISLSSVDYSNVFSYGNQGLTESVTVVFTH